jgi:hypothetical protein
MGNVITNMKSIMAFSQEEIKIPDPKTLSDRQVAIIKKSWEIPFAKVRIIVFFWLRMMVDDLRGNLVKVDGMTVL